MELKDKSSEVLQAKLNKTKKILQVLTWCAIITVGFLLYGWLMKEDGINSSFSMLPIAFASLVLILDLKYKKIKAELDSRV